MKGPVWATTTPASSQPPMTRSRMALPPREGDIAVVEPGVILVRDGTAVLTGESRRIVTGVIRQALRERVTGLELKTLGEALLHGDGQRVVVTLSDVSLVCDEIPEWELGRQV